jgi:hypothetical protein
MTYRYVHFAFNKMAAIQEGVSPMDKLEVKPMRVPKSRRGAFMRLWIPAGNGVVVRTGTTNAWFRTAHIPNLNHCTRPIG